jgi:3-deoxy-7-phosphoheptulonate synthase
MFQNLLKAVMQEIRHQTPQGLKLASRGAGRPGSVVRLAGARGPVELGGRDFVVLAGPCAVEGASQIEDAARIVAEAGCAVLRGGAFKPRTSPYAFQGLGDEGARLLFAAAERHGLATVTEILDPADLPALEPAGMLQVGARNMQNYALLQRLAGLRRPVLLKRGPGATVAEWLLAAEYLLAGGNDQVVLCERGIRTFETATRNTLDLSAVALAKAWTHLPVIVDPSHAAGRPELILPLSLAAAAAGADGILVEMHPHPEDALCDGAQALRPAELRELVARLGPLVEAVGRTLWKPSHPARRAAAR